MCAHCSLFAVLIKYIQFHFHSLSFCRNVPRKQMTMVTFSGDAFATHVHGMGGKRTCHPRLNLFSARLCSISGYRFASARCQDVTLQVDLADTRQPNRQASKLNECAILASRARFTPTQNFHFILNAIKNPRWQAMAAAFYGKCRRWHYVSFCREIGRKRAHLWIAAILIKSFCTQQQIVDIIQRSNEILYVNADTA